MKGTEMNPAVKVVAQHALIIGAFAAAATIVRDIIILSLDDKKN